MVPYGTRIGPVAPKVGPTASLIGPIGTSFLRFRGPTFSRFLCSWFRFLLKADVILQWGNYLYASAIGAGKTPLLLNLDETNVPVVYVHSRGTYMLDKAVEAWRRAPKQTASKVDQRMNFTLVAIICNDSSIQPILPQVLFVSEKCVTKTAWMSLCETLPSNVYVKRLKKGWNNGAEHCVILNLLGMILEPYLATMQPILYFDSARIHLTDESLAEMARSHIWFAVIPPRQTWLWQPLDTHAFVRFKFFLACRFIDELGTDGMHVPVSVRMIRLVVRAIREVLQAHKWAKSFEDNGLAGTQAQVSRTVKEALQYESLPEASAERPTLEMVRLCWPRNTKINEEHLWNAFPNVPMPGHGGPPVFGRYMIGGASGSAGPAVAGGAVAMPTPLEVGTRIRLKRKTTTDAFGTGEE